MIHTWDFIKSSAVVWGPFVSALIAAFIVHLLTQSREREKWILDCKKQEYRELLDALSDVYALALTSDGNLDGENGNRLFEATTHFVRIAYNRLYITSDISLEKIYREWLEATNSFSSRHDQVDFDKQYTRISQQIVQAANRSVPESTMQRLVFWKNE
jgi:hypothetical protein